MWHSAETGTPMRDLLQSLIQGAAAILQHHMGRQQGSKQLLERAQARMEPWIKKGHTTIYGVDVDGIFDQIAGHMNGADWPTLTLSS